MDHIKQLIDMAAEQKINRIQLSHDLLMYASEPVDKPQLAKDINTICDLAHAKGIKVVVWTRQLADIPEEFNKDGKIDLTNPATWRAIQGIYEKLFAVCPGIDGVVITTSEGSVSIGNDTKVLSDIPAADRQAKLIDTIDEVCRKHGKEIWCRSFAYMPKDLRVLQDGIKKAKADVIAMPKCVPHDWQPFYPYSPDIGDIGNKHQIVEFDLGHEFTGNSTVPYIMLGYMKRHIDHGVSKGIDGACFRVERMNWWALGTPNQAVIDISSRMLLNPSIDPYKEYKLWLGARYPKKAVPYLYSALVRTQDIVEKTLFVLGQWATNHSKLPDYNYAWSHMREYKNSKWDHSGKWTEIEKYILNPTAKTIEMIDADKDLALKLVDASIADIEKAKPHLKAADYSYYMDLFRREKAMVVVWKAAMDVIFGTEIYNTDKSDANAVYLAKAADTLAKVTEDNKEHLTNMMTRSSGAKSTGNIAVANGLVEQARKALGK